MKAAILTEKNKPLVVSDNVHLFSLGEGLKYGQVKVKLLVSGLCGAQLQEIAGLKNNEKFMPHMLGHEGCGVVEEIGLGVTKVKPGDKVVMHWRKGSGIEADFHKYIWDNKTCYRFIGGGKVTTLSEYSVASENRLTSVDSDIDDEFCALLGCGLSTGFSVINKEANIKFGESVLVIGCGGVGLNCIYSASLSHACPIFGLDSNPSKRFLVASNGGQFIHVNEVGSFISKKNKIDCIIDTTGSLSAVSKFLPLLSAQGRCILVAQPKPHSLLEISDPINFFSLNGQSIRTTQAGGFNPDVDIPRYIKLYKNKQICLNNLITDRIHIDDINQAVEKLKSGDAGRIMIHF